MLGDEISWEPDIYLYKIPPGMDIEEFEIPLVRFVYSVEFWRFVEDTEYARIAKPMLDNILMEIDSLKKEAYKKEIVKADSLVKSQNYEEAIIAYKSAGNFSDGETYPKNQIKTSD